MINGIIPLISLLIVHCKCLEIQLTCVYIDPVSRNLANSFTSSSRFLVDSLGFSNM